MNIIFDTRESALHAKYLSPLDSSQPPSIPISIQPLPLADIVIQYNSVDLILIERKSMSDLVSSIKDGRYEEQSYRLLSASNIHPHNIIYIIEGVFSQLRTTQEKKMAQSAITSLALFKGFSVFRTTCLNETAEIIAAMANKLNKEITAEGLQKLKYPNPNSLFQSQVEVQNATEESVQPPVMGDTSVVAASATAASAPAPAPYCTVVKKIKKENLTPEIIGQVILCQIPGISSTNAIEIMAYFDNNFRKFMEEIHRDPDCLKNIRLDGKRKLGSNVIQNILAFFP